ncbi:protein unc-13 homolog 4B isoform X3 [Phlebotomus papatasi]|uniref:protein unc-13 homolog 4B isoform X3 n=1 Tax=Phlebotomus papatasi TaxID=29031 RepID=UPI002483FE27|nr:protein unc-13 homolog 4B isoform X3 [Phlebotomus papatasi]XP_055698354.1 protein unc-13 homolog 4B isoform X3 [Phlebotomus papatasi]XP_055698355.1 protein unc-13 homolog 4B isoform X3 [Phlebotomus papatasi]
MDEEAMWKGFYEKLQEIKAKPPTEHESKIQDLDGGFFEKFGSLLRQKSIHDEEKMATPLAPLPEVAEEAVAEEAVALEARLLGEEGENDSGNETLHDTDSEPEDAEVKSLEFVEDAVGWNLEELYEEILYEILHNIGAEIETSQTSLFSYIQDAFKISESRHEELLEAAKTKEAPEIRLNVEVIEAKDLVPKDPNGLSDPFVTMYLAAAPTHRYNTSVKSETLNPQWEEHFSLPISDDANENILVVEVWDFDPAETVREKMNKIFDVKGVKGLRKLMKEIAVTASSGKHDNELIGKANIPLKSIPASGLVLWYNLDKKNRLKSRGLIKIRLSFSSEKNNRVAAQEHRHLLRILLLHELETSKVAPYWWSGKFTDKGESVLTQHTAQSGLTLTDVSLVEWSVYAGIHVEHPLAFSLFDKLLDKVIRPIQNETASSDEIKLFWDATKKLLPSCFAIIRKLRKKTAGDKNCVKTLMDVLNILAKIAMLEPPEGTDLFPIQQYGWIKENTEKPNWDIRGALKDAVIAGADDWFNTINDDTECQKGTDETKLQHIIKLIQLIRSDLQRAIEYYDKIFQETMRFHYARTLYGFYEGKLAEYVEPIVEEITKNLKRIHIPTHESAKLESHQEINMGTTLFELYLVLKRFAVLGTALDPGETNFKISNYHRWFNAGVTHWLDISVLKALIRIEKAIELDQLIPVDDSVKYSSSAVDTLAIFYQIKIFWQQLSWPDVEGSYMFVGKIVDDICRCCVFYADKMSERVEGLGEIQSVYEKKFEVTREWCLAINNIDYIRQSLPPFVKELGVDEIVTKLSDCRSPMEAERCAETLKNVIDNAVDTEKNKILELVETVARKMSPMMRRFLAEGAELLHQDCNSLDRLMMYLEESLKTLNMELNDVNFERILDAIWTELSNVLYDLVQSNLDKRRPPSFFSNLRDALQIMIQSFKGTKKCEASDRAVLNNIEQLLELHGFETADLIHQYYLDRLKEQQVIRETPYGQLTVRCCFKNLVLEIEVMNARNLRSMDSNGSCDPFVRIHFLPEEKFAGIVKPRTNAQSKTLFPLFDEKFVISLSPEQKANKNAIILFSVKDKDLFGMSNQYIAETYLSFGEIPEADGGGAIEQIHLPLTRPYNLDTDCIRALEYRIGDKQAKEFLKKLKQKINNQA